MANKIGYGAFLVGLVLIGVGCLYRIAVGNPGGPPPDAADDQRAIWVAKCLVIAGGAISAGGSLLGFALERSRWGRSRQAPKGEPCP
jgi:hypothetical protein